MKKVLLAGLILSTLWGNFVYGTRKKGTQSPGLPSPHLTSQPIGNPQSPIKDPHEREWLRTNFPQSNGNYNLWARVRYGTLHSGGIASDVFEQLKTRENSWPMLYYVSSEKFDTLTDPGLINGLNIIFDKAEDMQSVLDKVNRKVMDNSGKPGAATLYNFLRLAEEISVLYEVGKKIKNNEEHRQEIGFEEEGKSSKDQNSLI